jgi:antirestriction protein ArdC
MASKTRTRKPRLSRNQITAEALRNAVTRASTMNYEAIFVGFEAMGIPMEEVQPRENVFTYNAWLALGRQVRKGEHGVKVVTYIERKAKAGEAADAKPEGKGEGEGCEVHRFPRTTTVFHISQTDPVQAREAQPAKAELQAATA